MAAMDGARYDAIVVGAGAGGGVIAGVLAEAGKRVLLLERGRNLSFKEVGRDHLRNQRLSQYGNSAGPDGPAHPRVLETHGRSLTLLPHEGGYHNNAATVGGGTRVYGAQAWRFHPLDFQMASTYGVPEGSSLADWPIRFEDLEPFYARAEDELGVAGDASWMPHLPPYRTPYPMPPMPMTESGRVMQRGAKNLGWDAIRVPLAVNSVPRHGRPACINCQHCVGFACPVDAKNGTQNTLIPRALASGNCTLETDMMAAQILVDGSRAVGVAYFDASGNRIEAQADVVVVAGGAVESARLLLLSGLGNDNVGRNLQGHYYPGAMGRLPDPVYDGIGPGVTTAITQFCHGNEAEDGRIIGGAMLADDFVMLPATFWKRALPPGTPRWGLEAKRWMAENFRYCVDIKGPVQEIPSPDARVTLDSDVRDAYGLPVAHLSGTTHPETVRTARFMFGKVVEWLRGAGAEEIWGDPPGLYLSGGQHQAGTCRMGDDPATSATDRHCRVHGHDNLYVGDGSVHVTNGGFNPFLTIMALAYRTADHILASW